MPVSALLLALGAAVVHAVWNLLLARARDVEAATAVALALAVLLYAPLAVLTWDVRASVAPYAVGSSLFELAYIALLAAAYRRAELSVVYPLARGLAPVLVLLVGVALLAKPTSAGQVVGVALVCAGVLAVRGARREADPRGAAFGVAIAATIAGYTLFDSEGIRHAHPVAYLELVMIGPALVYLALIWGLRGAGALRAELSWPTLAAGIASFGAYLLALAALRRAPAASVAAVRETSIVVAVGLAAVFLDERVTRVRAAGAVLVAAGVAALSLA